MEKNTLNHCTIEMKEYRDFSNKFILPKTNYKTAILKVTFYCDYSELLSTEITKTICYSNSYISRIRKSSNPIDEFDLYIENDGVMYTEDREKSYIGISNINGGFDIKEADGGFNRYTLFKEIEKCMKENNIVFPEEYSLYNIISGKEDTIVFDNDRQYMSLDLTHTHVHNEPYYNELVTDGIETTNMIVSIDRLQKLIKVSYSRLGDGETKVEIKNGYMHIFNIVTERDLDTIPSSIADSIAKECKNNVARFLTKLFEMSSETAIKVNASIHKTSIDDLIKNSLI